MFIALARLFFPVSASNQNKNPTAIIWQWGEKSFLIRYNPTATLLNSRAFRSSRLFSKRTIFLTNTRKGAPKSTLFFIGQLSAQLKTLRLSGHDSSPAKFIGNTKLVATE
jgi:hypothetical protein